MPIARFLAVVIDCHDPAGLAGFWQEILGGSLEPRTQSPEWVALNDVPGFGILAFQCVPEAKTIKNRLHIDVDVTDIASSVEAAVALGAMTVGDLVEEPTNRFQVMRDPEGNEFCFVTSASVAP
jgi:predicted enzyme related to lactoylglutathione lyase